MVSLGLLAPERSLQFTAFVPKATFASVAVLCASLVVQACGSSSGNGGASQPDGGASSGGADGGSSSGGGAADGGGSDASLTDAEVATALSPPQVVNPAPAGPVLASPKVQLIAYAEDTYLPQIEAQLTELTKTQTWSQQTAEYGVGPLTIKPTITIQGTPPATLDDNTGSPTPFQTTLATNLTGATPAWGAVDPSTIYLFLLPQGTQINAGGLCCDPNAGYFGYHDQATVGSDQVAYAIVCNCPSFVAPPLTALDDLTTTVTHELGEAATDPLTNTQPAFAAEDMPHEIWGLATSGGEIADMCQSNTDANFVPAGATYMVQRSWSNKAALAGSNPCVPVPAGSGPYFNAYPVLPDMVTLSGTTFSPAITVPGVKVPVGGSKTIDIVLHSEAPTSGPWTVSVQDLSYITGTTSSPATKLTLDKTSGSDGDVLHLTIQVVSADPTFGGEAFVLSSKLGTQNNLWYGAVGQK